MEICNWGELVFLFYFFGVLGGTSDIFAESKYILSYPIIAFHLVS